MWRRVPYRVRRVITILSISLALVSIVGALVYSAAASAGSAPSGLNSMALFVAAVIVGLPGILDSVGYIQDRFGKDTTFQSARPTDPSGFTEEQYLNGKRKEFEAQEALFIKLAGAIIPARYSTLKRAEKPSHPNPDLDDDPPEQVLLANPSPQPPPHCIERGSNTFGKSLSTKWGGI
jgi:hypothetical protein